MITDPLPIFLIMAAVVFVAVGLMGYAIGNYLGIAVGVFMRGLIG